jgi:hypothetical protein
MPVPGSSLVQFTPSGGEFFIDVITESWWRAGNRPRRRPGLLGHGSGDRIQVSTTFGAHRRENTGNRNPYRASSVVIAASFRLDRQVKQQEDASPSTSGWCGWSGSCFDDPHDAPSRAPPEQGWLLGVVVGREEDHGCDEPVET